MEDDLSVVLTNILSAEANLRIDAEKALGAMNPNDAVLRYLTFLKTDRADMLQVSLSLLIILSTPHLNVVSIGCSPFAKHVEDQWPRLNNRNPTFCHSRPRVTSGEIRGPENSSPPHWPLVVTHIKGVQASGAQKGICCTSNKRTASHPILKQKISTSDLSQFIMRN